ncbi:MULTISPECIES: hypothetical protein [Nocardioides]|uniref:Uncharacterized protein n=1 Tax=Nocardioides vastitatis TaxID=2568655 RepID=A0ABW0ZLL7_9ACTN|nr:hypothetical protein [Nocardioides sp.]
MTEEQHPHAEGPPATPIEPPGMPVWVKELLIGVVVVVALVILVMVLSGGQHGPGMHG